MSEDEIAELVEMIDEAVGQCHSISHKARDLGHREADRIASDLANQLEQLHRQVALEYPE